MPSPFYIYFNFRGVTMPTLELDPNKKYTMPHPVITVAIDNKFLAIARETGNWVLLENNRQREIFDALSEGHRVAELFDLFSSDDRSNIIRVLTELEAKCFECTDYDTHNSMGCMFI